MKFGFIFLIITFLGLIAGASAILFKSGIAFGLIRSSLAQQIVKWFLILLPIILIITMTIGNKFYSGINSFLYIISVTWLPLLLYLFLGAVLLWLVKFIVLGLGLSSPASLNMFPYAIAIIFICSGLVAYGIINATSLRVVTYEINSPALAQNWSGKNIVLFSDTHLGVVRSEKFMQKVVKKVNETRPDLVLIAGDIIDGPVFDYKKGLSPLRNIQSTFGAVYTPGNHEAYNSQPEIFYPVVKNLTTTLVDQKIEINKTTIIGVDYRNESFEETRTRLEKIGFSSFEKNLPSIAILHDPRNIEALLDSGISLVVSGHTHCGQFFPFTLIVKSIYGKYTHGVVDRSQEKEIQNSNKENKIEGGQKNKDGISVITCGVGTAMSPLRLGTNPEIVVLKIK